MLELPGHEDSKCLSKRPYHVCEQNRDATPLATTFTTAWGWRAEGHIWDTDIVRIPTLQEFDGTDRFYCTLPFVTHIWFTLRMFYKFTHKKGYKGVLSRRMPTVRRKLDNMRND